tara:strand:+ start:467 stop:1177 length:711 start_codon:yes stop_codon:yes gene_type:complete
VPLTTQSRLKLHQNWAGDFPLKFLWTVNFSGRGASMSTVGDNVSNIIQTYEGGSFPVKESLIEDYSSSSNDLGLLLAQNASLPNEQLAIGTEALNNTGGFRAGYFADRRADYGSQNKLDLTFLETNVDLMDYFIKPWIIATSYKGLIEDGEDDIKCNIDLLLYSRSDEYYNDKFNSSNDFNRPLVEYKARKMYSFYNSAPFNIEGGQLSYNNEMSLDELSKTVSFTFSHYKVEDQQ